MSLLGKTYSLAGGTTRFEFGFVDGRFEVSLRHHRMLSPQAASASASPKEKLFVIEAAFIKQVRVIDDLKRTIAELHAKNIDAKKMQEEIDFYKTSIEVLKEKEAMMRRKAETLEGLLDMERRQCEQLRQRLEDIKERNQQKQFVDVFPSSDDCTKAPEGNHSVVSPRSIPTMGATDEFSERERTSCTNPAQRSRSATKPLATPKSRAMLSVEPDSASRRKQEQPLASAMQSGFSEALQMHRDLGQGIHRLPPSVNDGGGMGGATSRQHNPFRQLPFRAARFDIDFTRIAKLNYIGRTDSPMYLAIVDGHWVHLVTTIGASPAPLRINSAARSPSGAASLAHPYQCVKLFGEQMQVFVLDEQRPHEIVEALSTFMKSRLDLRRYFRISQLLSIFLTIAKAVQELHKQGRSHGNIEPACIFVQSSDGNPLQFALCVSGFEVLPAHRCVWYRSPVSPARSSKRSRRGRWIWRLAIWRPVLQVLAWPGRLPCPREAERQTAVFVWSAAPSCT